MKRNYVIFLAIFMILGISTSSNAMSFTSNSFDFGGIGFGKYSFQAYPSDVIFDKNGSSGQLDFFKVTLDSLAARIGKATASIPLSNGSSFNEEGGYWRRGTNKNNQNHISVPEPGAMLSLGMVLLGLVAVSRKRFNQRN